MIRAGPFSSFGSEHAKYKYYLCKRGMIDEGGRKFYKSFIS